MVCACHRHGLFAMAHTNHTLPTECLNGACTLLLLSIAHARNFLQLQKNGEFEVLIGEVYWQLLQPKKDKKFTLAIWRFQLGRKILRRRSPSMLR